MSVRCACARRAGVTSSRMTGFLPARRRALAALLFVGLASARAAAQASSLAAAGSVQAPSATAAPEHPRPQLRAGADPWDAQSYMGEAWRAAEGGDAKRAVAAAYWATRVDPSSSEALFTYWRMRWFAEPKLRQRIERGDRKAYRSPEVARIDSIHLRALLRNPLGTPTAGAAKPPLWMINAAMDGARRALVKDSSLVGAWVFLATEHYDQRNVDSTIHYLRGALRALERVNADRLGPVYESREIFHYALARALYATGDVNAARAEYAKAATEALQFAPAHAELGSIAWSNWSDLALARQEYDLALELRDDPVVRYDYGTVLLDARQFAAALEQFDRVIAAEPWFARAHFNRALALDRLDRRAEALAAYRLFLERAPRRLDQAIEAATVRVAALQQADVPAASVPASNSASTPTP